MEKKTHFRGWAIPGPDVPGGLEPGDDQTLDALSGRFRIFQYRSGHRFSTDDVLAAWYGTTVVPRADRVLDLGSGIGSVGMIAAWRLPGAKLVTVEAQTISSTLARKSVEYNGLGSRYEIREGDLRDPGLFVENERFDLILSSPPYFPRGTGIEAEHPQKAACRFELRGAIEDYSRVASERLSPGGVFSSVFPWAQRDRLGEAHHQAGLKLIRTRPVILREGEDPLLMLSAAMNKSDLPDSWDQGWQEPSLIIRKDDGSIHPEYASIKLSIGFPP